jgi:putative ABC transport system permease protein
MRRQGRKTLARPWLWLVRVIGVIVPRRLRVDWRQEWEAELRYRESLLAEWDKLDRRAKLALLWHSAGAFMDALWLQPKRLEDEMFQDLRYGLRMILNRPGFSAAVVLILALGIGATSAIFSLVNSVLLRPLPYPEPDRLMMVSPTSRRASRNGSVNTSTGPDYVEWRNQCRSCAEVAAYSGTGPSNLMSGAEPYRARVAQVTGNLFATLGVQPILGRTFLPEETGGRSPFVGDGAASGPGVVILSYGLWQRRFGADPSVIGKTVKVEGDACAVIGVMPDGFKFPGEAEAWTPVTISPTRNNSYMRVIARLQAGVTQAQAQAELATIARRLEQEFPQTNQGRSVNLVPLQEYVVGNVRSSLLIFMGAVGFVLLIACANVANLLLARAATRQKEMAVRAALGAGRLRIIRQLLTESLLLALAGGGLGLSLAFGILKLLLAFAPQEIPRLNDIGIDPRALCFTLLLSILTGVIFGLAPALQASRPDLNATLKEGGTRATSVASRHRLRGLLVIAEVSMALVLLIGAGLLLKSFARLRETKLGFNPDHVLTARVTLPESTHPTAAQVKSYYQQALARVAARPDAQAAGLVNMLPLGDFGLRGSLTVEGETEERPGVTASKLAVGGDYFRALGIPLLKGRAFNERDAVDSPAVLIISESLARNLWPDGDAIGKRIDIGLGGNAWREVVGVVGDVRQMELGAPPAMSLYQPYQQVSDRLRWFVEEMTFVARTTAEPLSFVASLRSELQAVDRELPMHSVATMEQVVAKSVADQRFYTLLLGSFSALALILAAAGIYSVISYSVTQRTHEIGVRLALGAQPGAILRLVVRQGMALTLAGLAIGLGGALALTRVLSDFLYQVSVTDPATFALLSAALVAVALLACWIPARRATEVDPLVALRQE